MEAGKNIVLKNKLTLDNAEYEKQIGWPIILSLSYKIFGIDNYVAIYTTIFLSCLSIFAFYLFTYLLFKKEKIAIISSLIYTLFPLRLQMAASVETITFSLLFIFLTLCSFIIYSYNLNFKTQILGWLFFFFTIQIRLENILLLIPIIFILRKEKLSKKHFIILFLFIPFIYSFIFQYLRINNFYVKAYSGNIIFYGFSLAKFTLFNNLELILLFIGMVGFLYYVKNRNFFLLFCMISFSFPFIYNYADTFHFLPFFSFLIVLIGYLLFRIKKQFLIGLLIILLIISFYNIEVDDNLILQTKLMHDLEIPKDCFLISSRSIFFTSTRNLRAYSVDEAINKLRITPYFFEECTYYIEDILCYKNYYGTDAIKKCKEIKKKFKFNLFDTFSDGNSTVKYYSKVY